MKILLPLILFCCWQTAATAQITRAGWLTGTWEHKTPRGITYETWKKVSADELQGASYSLEGNDTTIFESVRLLQKEGRLYYVPTVKGQNNGQPVSFALKQATDEQLVFENPQHDFPQTVSYRRIGADSLVAQISGTRNGQFRTVVFPMKKIR
ncbi:DUF6265 family protein [Chitinophaga sp. GCM10012297]|uniref:DUF6265 domain-containing protein n=1 Tax=Chitinophaga chungangae TaxID=2821488 RepID=A0ABS3YA45_9BACT|nr:DUF6265 family protein [Chitinophaga chungangae]MBO9151544.1 hypothetical protein [Chitinophaga chungangae]